jgi:hypothetical protein
MPIPIIIAILVALFTLGTKMNQPKGGSAQVVIESEKINRAAIKKQNHDNLVEVANEAKGEATVAGEQPENGDVENSFRIWTLYHIIE